MKLNVKVRMKNPYFWVGVLATIITAMGLEPEMFTSWSLVWDALVDLFTNPFRLCMVVIAVMGIFIDPTTSGVSDSEQAMTYIAPKKAVTHLVESTVETEE